MHSCGNHVVDCHRRYMNNVCTVYWFCIDEDCTSLIHCRSLTDKSGEISSKRAKLSTPPQTLPAVHVGESFQELPDELQSVLPSDYSYHLQTFEELPKSTFLGAPGTCFKTKFYIKLDNEAAARQWIQKFEDK